MVKRSGKAHSSSCEALGIKLITARISHPQTNREIERFFSYYNRHGDDFDSLDNFVYWCNNVRFHESLDTEYYFQSKDTFLDQLPVGIRVSLAAKLFDEV